MSVECGFELGGAVTAKTVRGARRNGNDGIYPWRGWRSSVSDSNKKSVSQNRVSPLAICPAAETVFCVPGVACASAWSCFLGFTPIFWGSPALLGSLGVVLAENRLSVLLSLLRPP